MEMFEVWQIRLAVILFLCVTDWLAYYFISYWVFKERPKYLAISLVIPIAAALIILALTTLSSCSASEEAAYMIGTSFLSIIPYFILILFNAQVKLKDNTIQKSIHPLTMNHFSILVGLTTGSIFASSQLLPVVAYANNINNFTFQKKSSNVQFPEIVASPESIYPVLNENKLNYQIWLKESSFSIPDKPIVIEITSDGFNRDILNRARKSITRKQPGFPIFKFKCDENYQTFDQWVIIKALSISELSE